MAEEGGKGISLVILGIVAILAIIGLVLLFRGPATGAFSAGVPPSKAECRAQCEVGANAAHQQCIKNAQSTYDACVASCEQQFPRGIGGFSSEFFECQQTCLFQRDLDQTAGCKIVKDSFFETCFLNCQRTGL
jgi:hypothetical protein